MTNVVVTESFDMTDVSVADLRAPAVAQTTTSFAVTHPDHYTEWYLGSNFTFNGGAVTGGTFDTLVLLDDQHVETGRFSGVGGSVTTFMNLAGAGDTLGVLNLLLSGSDQFTGSGGADTIFSLGGDDIVFGGAGADSLNGNMGADTVHGGNGSDTVLGGQGSDFVYGDAGDDGHVNGNLGDDHVFGGLGNDTLYGGQGSDTVSGDEGNDLISGDRGNDVLIGGAGADRFAFQAGMGVDWVADFNAGEGDRVQLAPGTAYTVVDSGGQAMIMVGAGGDGIGLAGVSFASFSTDWVVFG